MDLAKVVGALKRADGGISTGVRPSGDSVGGDERSSLRSAFQRADRQGSLEERARRRIEDAADVEDRKLRDTLRYQERRIQELDRKVRDYEEEISSYEDIVASFKSEKNASEQRLAELSKDLEEARSVELPLEVEYDSATGVLKVGGSETESASAQDFINFISTLSVVFPDIVVRLKIEEVEGTAKEVSDSCAASWDADNLDKFKAGVAAYSQSPSEEAYNELRALANEYGSYPTAVAVCNLSRIEDLERVKALCDEVVATLEMVVTSGRDAAPHVESEEGEGEAKPTIEAPKVDPDEGKGGEGVSTEEPDGGTVTEEFVLDSVLDYESFVAKLRTLGLVDSVMKRIPGTPSRFRIADSASDIGGFESPSVVQEGEVYIIFE